jgi:hypothetical protein
LIVYDNSSGIFLQDIYNDSSIYSGTALSLISSDNSSNTFLQITTPDSNGWVWGAGIFPGDSTRNMGTSGWMDISGKYIPTEIIVSGNSLVKIRSTIGINTFAPTTETYSMDINGPIHIHHNEIHLIKKVFFEIKAISFCKTNTKYGIAVGTSLSIESTPYKYDILYTTNAGNTWNVSSLLEQDYPIIFNVFMYDQYNAIISGNNGFNFTSAVFNTFATDVANLINPLIGEAARNSSNMYNTVLNQRSDTYTALGKLNTITFSNAPALNSSNILNMLRNNLRFINNIYLA